MKERPYGSLYDQDNAKRSYDRCTGWQIDRRQLERVSNSINGSAFLCPQEVASSSAGSLRPLPTRIGWRWSIVVNILGHTKDNLWSLDLFRRESMMQCTGCTW